MSKKWKGAKVVLGPNGKPLPPSKPIEATLDWGPDLWGDAISQTFKRYTGLYSISTVESAHKDQPTAKPDLLAGLDALVADLSDFETGVQELPEPPRDMSTYVDAFAVAAKKCTHENYEDTMYAKREAKCNDCGKYFVRPKGMWGF